MAMTFALAVPTAVCVMVGGAAGAAAAGLKSNGTEPTS